MESLDGRRLSVHHPEPSAYGFLFGYPKRFEPMRPNPEQMRTLSLLRVPGAGSFRRGEIART